MGTGIHLCRGSVITSTLCALGSSQICCPPRQVVIIWPALEADLPRSSIKYYPLRHSSASTMDAGPNSATTLEGGRPCLQCPSWLWSRSCTTHLKLSLILSSLADPCMVPCSLLRAKWHGSLDAKARPWSARGIWQPRNTDASHRRRDHQSSSQSSTVTWSHH